MSTHSAQVFVRVVVCATRIDAGLVVSSQYHTAVTARAPVATWRVLAANTTVMGACPALIYVRTVARSSRNMVPCLALAFILVRRWMWDAASILAAIQTFLQWPMIRGLKPSRK